MESVYQLVRQFPAAFEFGENFLQIILYHTYSCLFGTLLGDCESERVRDRIATATHSLWTYLLENRRIYAINTNFQALATSDRGQNDPEDAQGGEPTAILRPNPKDVRLWVKAHFPLFEES